MYTQLAGTVASATDVAGSVSAAEMTRGHVAADLSAAVFMGAAIASLHGISNDFVDPPGI
ncbi:hypothetical protein NOJ28_08090 [Neorhizobium galegae]|uniref:hypothetical protein n=1 Tax=Neorhizobium galegae TaxID=399 RepID=UPI0006221CE3|nr:hypothetical protein [Neorhizobium galegae]MCQ1765484.1 hypothetical protein [Neorhizobium galegae]MCQ1844398.1 hypothetical protein [Neorhizobium galegae]CDZ33110.1 Hypothetical protein NGAL_HAMBI1146_02210 [Neorhizobium galegae bv. officinalis]